MLTFGIVLALIMRAIFIALGAALLSLFSVVFLLFGLLDSCPGLSESDTPLSSNVASRDLRTDSR